MDKARLVKRLSALATTFRTRQEIVA